MTTDMEYVAVYMADPVTYTVTFRDDTGNIYATQTYHYGDVIEIPQNPSKPATATHTYRFVGWSEPVSETVEKDMIYVAQFTPVSIEEGKKPGVDNLLSPGQPETSIPVLGITIVAITAAAVVGCVIWMLNKKRG